MKINENNFVKWLKNLNTEKKKTRFHILFRVLPIVILFIALKIIIHVFNFEFLVNTNLSSYFSDILLGIIFLLGFLLAGVLEDYKESEKIPNVLVDSLYTIWQEGDYLSKVYNLEIGDQLKKHTIEYIEKLDFFLKIGINYSILNNPDNIIHKDLDYIYDDIIEIGKKNDSISSTLKKEIILLRKYIHRIIVIKKTDFAPALNFTMWLISIIFLIIYVFLKMDSIWVSITLTSMFTFILFSILILINDMDDPFESDGINIDKIDEVNFKVLEKLLKELKMK